MSISRLTIRSTTVRLLLAALLLVPVHTELAAEEKERLLQFGLFPPVSSNGVSSGKTVNTVSLNLIGGYNAGVRAFELGGVWNASRDFTKGVQVAGILNYSGNSCNSVQISGVVNVAASGKSPFQLAGLVNVGEHVNGLQLSALVNVAKTVGGVQVGLINVVEDGEKGVSIGLINIAQHGGKYEFEVAFSDAINTMLSFRLGTERFYTIFSGGMNYFFSPLEYAAGLGFGTGMRWKRGWGNQIEVQAFGVTRDGKFTSGSVNAIAQLRLLVSKELAKHFKIFAGPALNLGLQSPDAAGNTGTSLAPWTMWRAQWQDVRAEGWIGFSAGFRF